MPGPVVQHFLLRFIARVSAATPREKRATYGETGSQAAVRLREKPQHGMAREPPSAADMTA